MTFTRDIDTAESARQKIKDLELIQKTQEQTKPYIDHINSRLEYYELVLQPKAKRKRQKQPILEEELL